MMYDTTEQHPVSQRIPSRDRFAQQHPVTINIERPEWPGFLKYTLAAMPNMKLEMPAGTRMLCSLCLHGAEHYLAVQYNCATHRLLVPLPQADSWSRYSAIMQTAQTACCHPVRIEFPRGDASILT